MRALGCWVIGLVLSVSAGGVLAGVDMGLRDCHVRFASDFSVQPTGVNSTQAERVYVLKPSGEVRVDGAPVVLSAEQRALVVDYTRDLQAFMPTLVTFVKDLLDTVGEVVAQALAQAFGETSEPAVKVRESLALADTKFSQRMAAHPGEYRVVDERLDVLDGTFDDDIEAMVEEAVTASIGSVWSLLGSAMFSAEGDFETRMAAFGAKMERFGEQVEKQMEAQEPALDARGDALCAQAEKIEQLEYRLRETIPELAHYRLMDSRKKAREAANNGELRAR